MKKLLVLFLCLVMVSGGAASFVAAIGLDDPLNKHNLSSLAVGHPRSQTSGSGIHGTTEVCVFCHTPHGASSAGPLWNRPSPTPPGALSAFPLYNSALVIKGDQPDFTGVPADAVSHSGYTNADPTAYPNGSTKLCLSCHDGVTALGVTLNDVPFAMTQSALTGANIVDLAFSHPVSFVYDSTVLADIQMSPSKAGNYRLPDTTATPLTISVVPLDSRNRMQCTTCHDPHNDTRSAGSPESAYPFWRNLTGNASDDYNQVCNTCHTTPEPSVTEHGLR